MKTICSVVIVTVVNIGVGTDDGIVTTKGQTVSTPPTSAVYETVRITLVSDSWEVMLVTMVVIIIILASVGVIISVVNTVPTTVGVIVSTVDTGSVLLQTLMMSSSSGIEYVSACAEFALSSMHTRQTS